MTRRTMTQLAIFAAAAFAALFYTSRVDFLLFHSLTEMFTVLVLFGIFVIAWNTRDIADNNYLAVLGTGFLFVALTTLVHTLAYQGMGVFPGHGANLPTQLWILSRILEVAALLMAGLTLTRPVTVRWTFVGFGALWTIGMATIFVWPIFPAMYVDGVGLTAAKTGIEHVLIALLAVSMLLVWRGRNRFEAPVARVLLAAIALMMATEYAFTLYVTVVDIASFFGHYFMMMSFVFVYVALVETSLRRPFSLLFRELKATQLAEHEIAEVLQGALVCVPDRVASVDFGYAFQSATTTARVGGDFYDLYAPSERYASFVIGDVCGKGIAATAATAMLRTTLRVLAYDDPQPADVLSRANDVVRRQLASDKFITVIYGVIDVHTGTVIVGSAGHPGPVLIHGEGAEAVELPGNPPLGVVEGHDFAVSEMTLAPGDTLLLFTDGCIDAGPHHASFGTDRVVEVASVPYAGPRETAEAVLDAATRFAGGKLSDDVAVVGIRFAGRGR